MTRPDPLKALLNGVMAGAFVLVLAVVCLRLSWAGLVWPEWIGSREAVTDLAGFGLPVVVAPVAAAVSAFSMRASIGFALAVAGVAMLVAFVTVDVFDYVQSLALFVPGLWEPYPETGELSAVDVPHVAQAWHQVRHVVAGALGLIGGSILGVWGGLSLSSDS